MTAQSYNETNRPASPAVRFENPRFSTDGSASLAALLSDTGNRWRFPDPLRPCAAAHVIEGSC